VLLLQKNLLLHKWRMWGWKKRMPTKVPMLSLTLRVMGKVNSLIGIHPTCRFLILILTIEVIRRGPSRTRRTLAVADKATGEALPLWPS
jgi:hypothetical protein